MENIFTALIYNAALLVAAVAIYDMAVSRPGPSASWWRQLGVGLLLGTVGIGVMARGGGIGLRDHVKPPKEGTL